MKGGDPGISKDSVKVAHLPPARPYSLLSDEQGTTIEVFGVHPKSLWGGSTRAFFVLLS